MSQPTPFTAIFMHMPHTGGTTLRDIARRNYPADAIFEGYDRSPLQISDYLAMSDDQKRRYRCFMAHLLYGIHRYIPGESVYFTMLRYPVDRVLSDYRRIITRPDHVHHQRYITEKITLEQHLEAGLSTSTQFRQLVGTDDPALLRYRPAPRYAPPDEAVDIAKAHLDAIPLVGLTERFDESVVLLSRALGWHDTLYIRMNVTRPDLARPTEQDRQLVAQYCQPEIAVYEYAVQRFEALIRAQGDGFAQAVADYRERNHRHQQAYERLERLKQPIRPLSRRVRALARRLRRG